MTPTPFRFFARLALTLATGRRARSIPELLEGIRVLPDAVIYRHTHRFLHEYQFLVPKPPHDFAYWATEILGDPELGEHLAAVDPLRFDSIAALRAALVRAVETALGERPDPAPIPAGREFHFLSARRFSVPTPHVAQDLAGFRRELALVSDASLFLHLFEARLRLPPGSNDFSLWLRDGIGEGDLAAKVGGLEIHSETLEGLRRRILALVDARLEEAHGPA